MLQDLLRQRTLGGAGGGGKAQQGYSVWIGGGAYGGRRPGDAAEGGGKRQARSGLNVHNVPQTKHWQQPRLGKSGKAMQNTQKTQVES